MPDACVIAIDWGSTMFRAFLLDSLDSLIEKKETFDGILQTKQSPSSIFSQYCGPWLKSHPSVRVILSGSVGSNIGWVNTAYLRCPVGAGDLSHNLVPVPNHLGVNIEIVPGVCGVSISGIDDVMRGEEVQIMGAMDIAGLENAVICLPGTHSKWAIISENKISQLSSFMSGELFQFICQQSSVSSVIEHSGFDAQSFLKGLEFSKHNGGLLHHLFSARAMSLLKNHPYASHSAFVSGLILGSEVRETLAEFKTQQPILLVSNDTLQDFYQHAFEYFGISYQYIDSEAAFIRGIATITAHTHNS